MLDEYDIRSIANDITNIYSSVETACIKSIVARLQAGKSVLQADLWRMNKLNEVGLLRRELLTDIRKATSKSFPEIEALIQASLKKSRSRDAIHLEGLKNKAGLSKDTLLFKVANSKNMEKIAKRVTAQCKSIYNLTNTKAMQGSLLVYHRAINNAYLAMSTGNATYEEAVKQAVKKIGQTGIQIVDRKEKVSDNTLFGKNGELFTTYRNGDQIRIYPLDSAIRRDLITTINQGSARLTLDDCGTLGTHLVETSWHNGARPEHEVWQGKIFSLDPNDTKYPYFYGPLEAGLPDYGNPLGICGINCYHSFSPYFEGAEKATKAGKKNAEENEEQYKNQQTQRAYERRLRALKRQQVALRTGHYEDDAREVQKIINKTSQNYSKFLSDTGLTRVSMLERVEGYKRVNVRPKPSAPRTVKTNINKAPYVPYENNMKCSVAESFGKDGYDAYVTLLDNCRNQNVSNAYKKVENLHIEKTRSKDNMFYNARSDYIQVYPNHIKRGSYYEKPMQTLFHEMGHAVDYHATSAGADRSKIFSVTWQEGRLKKTIKDDVEALLQKVGGKDKIKELVANLPPTTYADFSDIIEGATEGDIRLGFGHGRAYWRSGQDRLPTEAFAELLDSYIANKESYQFLSQQLPNVVACFEDMLDDLVF